MEMEIEGVIIRDLGVREGTTGDGRTWKMASYVIETVEQYPKRMMFDVSDGESGRIARLGIAEGKRMKVYFGIDAREHEGRWFNRIQAYDAREQQ
jgi:hypothetical protein